KWSTAYDRYCGDAERNLRVYCHPKYFEGLPSTLYRNRGDGTFEDVSAKVGIAKFAGRGMSVAFADYDQDGLPDVFVTALAGETFPVFRNLGKGSFADATYATKLGALSVKHSG